MPDHSTAAALLRAVSLAPDDDAPRLVYADWLDENAAAHTMNTERAALIRRMVAAPTYEFTFNNSLRAIHPKHKHAETVKAIRGLKPRLQALCREEWGARPGVERVVMRRGFAEAVTLPAHVFLATAGELFAAHPFRDVRLVDLWARGSMGRPGTVEVGLSAAVAVGDRWPAVLFPDRSAGDVLNYSTSWAALNDLSRRAAGYGRRMAGIIREPPPLPRTATEAPRGRHEGYGI